MPEKFEKLAFPVVLDGGLSNLLEARGCDLKQKLWCAEMLRSNPEAIVEAHLAYLRAGAEIITTASYQASIPGFVEAGLSAVEGEALLLRSVELADRAREIFREERNSDGCKALVAASIGPYGAYLADGSEYTGNYSATDAELREFHCARLRCLAQCGADLLAIETQPCLREIAILADLLADIEMPAWVSFCCRDANHLHDGSFLHEAIAAFKDVKSVFAIGANCTAPSHISEIIRLVKQEAPGNRVIVYPNSGEVYHASTGTWLGLSEPSGFRSMAADWIAEGADIIGGCCRIGPAHIATLREQVATARRS
ncbi:MAG: homocysteine S-methyltransferase [Chromatiales bacterium]|jgi:homocysteine S-methyltransferase